MATKSEVVRLRVATSEVDAWRLAAGGFSLSSWMRGVLNEQVGMDVQVERKSVERRVVSVVPVLAGGVLPGFAVAKPPPGLFCEHGNQRGYCSVCPF